MHCESVMDSLPCFSRCLRLSTPIGVDKHFRRKIPGDCGNESLCFSTAQEVAVNC